MDGVRRRTTTKRTIYDSTESISDRILPLARGTDDCLNVTKAIYFILNYISSFARRMIQKPVNHLQWNVTSQESTNKNREKKNVSRNVLTIILSRP